MKKFNFKLSQKLFKSIYKLQFSENVKQKNLWLI